MTELPWKYSSQKARRMFAPLIASGEAVCAKCGTGIAPGQRWDIDHRVPQDVAPHLIHDPDNWTVAHARCNRRAGAAYGNRKRAARITYPRPSREW